MTDSYSSNILALTIDQFKIGIGFVAFHRIHIVGGVRYRVRRHALCLELTMWLLGTDMKDDDADNLKDGQTDSCNHQRLYVEHHSCSKQGRTEEAYTNQSKGCVHSLGL